MKPADRLGLVSRVVAGKYRIEELLGEGGVGIVYGATNLLLGEPIAIKFIKDQGGSGTDAAIGFLKEAKLLFSLAHPGIVRMYDVGELATGRGTLLYVVLERVSGVSLEQEIERRKRTNLPFREEEIWQLFHRLLDAVAYAHSSDVVHRDLKPSNVMLTPEGAVKVLDFGTARSGEQATRMTVHFTPRYAAPEQWDPGRGPRGAWTDVYALGLILYELATLKKAAPGNDLPTIIRQAMNPQRPSFEQERPELARLVPVLAGALRLVGSERFANAQQMKAAMSQGRPSFLPKEAPGVFASTHLTDEGRALRAALDLGNGPELRAPLEDRASPAAHAATLLLVSAPRAANTAKTVQDARNNSTLPLGAQKPIDAARGHRSGTRPRVTQAVEKELLNSPLGTTSDEPPSAKTAIHRSAIWPSILASIFFLVSVVLLWLLLRKA